MKHKGIHHKGLTGKITLLPSMSMIGHVLGDLLILGLGVLAGAFAARKWSKGGQGTAAGGWDPRSYALAIAGGWAAGLIAAFLKKGPNAPKYAYHGLVGGALLAIYQYTTKSLSAKSATIQQAIGGCGTAGLGWENIAIGAVFTYPKGTERAGQRWQRLGAGEWKYVGMLGEVIKERELGEVIQQRELGEVIERRELGAVVDLSDRRAERWDSAEKQRNPFRDAFTYAGMGLF